MRKGFCLMESVRRTIAALRGARVVPAAVLTLLGILVLWITIRKTFVGRIGSSDVFVYCEYARHLLSGEGWVGHTLFTLDLWARGWNRVPLESGRALFPLIIAVFGRLTPDLFLAAVQVSVCVYVATIPALFRLARAAFGLRAAGLASLLYIFSPAALRYALWGYSDTLFALFLVLAVGELVGDPERMRGVWRAGGWLGLMALTRPAGVAFMLPLVVWAAVSRPGRAWRCAVALLLPAVALGLGVEWTNRLVFGADSLYGLPYGWGGCRLLHQTAAFPEHSILSYLVLPDSPLHLLRTDPYVRGAVIYKVLCNLREGVPRLPEFLGGAAVTALAVLGVAVSRGRVRLGLGLWFAGSVALLASLLALTIFKSRYFYPLTPFVLVLAAHGATRVVDLLPARWNPVRTVCLAVMGGCLLVSPVREWGAMLAAASSAPELSFDEAEDEALFFTRHRIQSAIEERFGRWLDAALPPERPYLCDSFMRNADYFSGGGRPVALYPRTFKMLERLHREKAAVDAILLTPLTNTKHALPEWIDLYTDPKPFDGFEPRVYRDGRFQAVLYERDSVRLARSRWNAAPRKPELFLPAMLPYLGEVLRLDPRQAEAAGLLAKLRETAAGQGREAEELGKTAFGQGRLDEAIRCFALAGALVDGVRHPEISGMLRKAGGGWVRYTHNRAFDTHVTLSGYPCSRHWTGLCLNGSDLRAEGERAPVDLWVDLGGSRQVDLVRIVAYLDPALHRAQKMTVFSSLDQRNWVPVCEQVFFPDQAGIYCLMLPDLGLFAPYVMVRLEGMKCRSGCPFKIEVWGCGLEPAAPGRDGHDLVQVDIRSQGAKLNRRTGREGRGFCVEADGARDAPGLLGFGRRYFLFPGRYRLDFQARANPRDAGRPVAVADVAAENGRRTIASADLRAGPGSGAELPGLDFSLEEPAWVEPRLYFLGNGTLVNRGLRITGCAHIRMCEPDGRVRVTDSPRLPD